MALVALGFSLIPWLWALAATIPSREARTGVLWALLHVSATGALLLWLRADAGVESATLRKLLAPPLLAGGIRLVYEIHRHLTGHTHNKP
ncbi:hypothetical protein [Streptomyces botrytidirepellens]|uniref:Uncharacterized protein n=1 Tax=Streptomyces botrytidirepellens TaxID=2486417 RepID=A0A3M8W6J2_9ACTN|nr:hypothetical protein [Streptomyces botrytidirepellens]RNG25117.1 hypothetical protein EEJ42_16750 [Streptomyces botrytidirepellens]